MRIHLEAVKVEAGHYLRAIPVARRSWSLPTRSPRRNSIISCQFGSGSYAFARSSGLSEPVPEPLADVARAWALGGHVEDAVEVALELGIEYWRLTPNQRSYTAAVAFVASRRRIPAVPVQAAPGPVVFESTISTLRAHYFFESEWHYVLVALFVLQARIVTCLPAVFYLFFGGRFGTGKTNILRLIADLTGGLLLENVSVAALARTITEGRVVCIDEFDVSRGKDVDEVRDALVRQGYKATAAPYMRWNAAAKEVERFPSTARKYWPSGGQSRTLCNRADS